MITFIVSYPLTCDPKDILLAQQHMQQSNWYCSDVQVRGKYPFYAEKMWREKGVQLEIYPGDLETLEQGTVDFMSFS